MVSSADVGIYLLTVAIWGSAWIGLSFQVGTVPPAVSITYRFALAGAIMLGWCLVRRLPLGFPVGDHLRFAVQGALLFSLNNILYYSAVAHLTSGLVAVANTSIVFMNIGLVAALGTAVPLRVVGGAALGILGIAVIFWPELLAFDNSGQAWTGIGLALAGTALSSAGQVLSSANQKAGLPVAQTSAWAMVYGGVLTAAVALVRGDPFVFDPGLPYVASLLYLTLFSTILAFTLYFGLLARLGPERAGYASLLYPMIALTLSSVFEGYEWTSGALAGMVLIVAGNTLVLYNRANRGGEDIR